MSRNLRSTIPALTTHFKPKVVDAEAFQGNREEIQQRQKLYHDKHAHSLPKLEKGVHARMRDEKKWKSVIITKKASEPRS